jgi:fermentation-respiration switch protein FrsA (DUF1100 family)
MNWRKASMTLIFNLLLIYLAVLTFLYFYQRHMMYFPGDARPAPEALGISAPEIVVLNPEDGLMIEGWFWPPSKAGYETIVFFHGNGQDYQYWMNKLKLFRDQGYGTLHAEYRAYGGNPGRPSEDGFYRDAKAYMNWLQQVKRTDFGQIVLYGESLGTGIAVQMATEFPVKAMLLESAYTSVADVAQSKYPIFPVHWLLKDQYQSIQKIAALKMPKFFIHAAQDQVIPIRFGQRLYEAALEPKTFVTIEASGHNDLYDNGAPLHVLAFLSTMTNMSADADQIQEE